MSHSVIRELVGTGTGGLGSLDYKKQRVSKYPPIRIDTVEVKSTRKHKNPKTKKIAVFRGEVYSTIIEPNGMFSVVVGKHVIENQQIGQGWKLV